jgi:hypothetical protein
MDDEYLSMSEGKKNGTLSKKGREITSEERSAVKAKLKAGRGGSVRDRVTILSVRVLCAGRDAWRL